MNKSPDSAHSIPSGNELPLQKRLQGTIVEQLHGEALAGESYEDASDALTSIEALQNFRSKLRGLPFGSFYEIIEEVTNANALQISKDELARTRDALCAAMEQRATRFSPRVADVYLALLAQVRGESYEPKFDATREKITELKDGGDLDVLFSSRVGWDMKFNRIETRLVGFLSGLRALDRRDGMEMDDDVRAWRQKQLEKAPTKPPARRNESKPGVDAMKRLKEGERAPAVWTIDPGFDATKYFKEQSFSTWDAKRNVWIEEGYHYNDIVLLQLCEDEDSKTGRVNVTLTATVAAEQWVSCPIPYTHGLHSIEATSGTIVKQQDQNGDIVIFVEGEGDSDVRIILAAKKDRRLSAEKPVIPTVPDMPSEFSDETLAKLGEIRKKYAGNVQRARALAAYARSRIAYLKPKDSAEAQKYNVFYATHTKGFAGAVDEIRQADCDVANTYFAALCSKLNIPVRHVIGHSVKGRDNEGASSINIGTGHGWSEIWDKLRHEWLMIDATPAGDPNLEDERERGVSPPWGYVAGDTIEQEAVRPSDEKLEALRKKLAERKEQLSYTKEERQLAEGAGVDLKEARKIVKEINIAEQTRLPTGELVVDALSKLFNLIIESRKTPSLGYTGPVRESEGGEEIESFTQHYIQAQSGQMDPRTRRLPTTEMHEDKIMGGIDLYVVGDKSGSMSETVEGEGLWELQRRAEYLIFSSLHRFGKNSERAGLQKKYMLSVRTQGISFRGDDLKDIDIDKSISSEFTAQDKVKMWHSLTEQGNNNGDARALSYICEQIKAEIEGGKKKGGDHSRLRLVIACSDGGYIGDDAVAMRGLAEELNTLGVVVVGIGLTESAANVPVVMENPPFSRGEIIRDINDLPAVVAKYVVFEAIKLFPEKARENAKQEIERAIAKFAVLR